jgi:hypothetical protein
MSIFFPTRTTSPLGRRIARRIAGRTASVGLFCALVTSLGACKDDDDSAPAEPTAVAGASDRPDASVRELPGDGREPTPEFDIEARQRDPIGPEQLVETIGDLVEDAGIGRDGYTPPAPVAPGDADPDAGAVNGGN